MYGDHPPSHLQHLQHAQQPFDPAGGLPVDLHAQTIMEPADFNAFSYDFQDIHDPSAMMTLQNQSTAAAAAPYTADGNSHHQPVTPAQAPPESLRPMAVPGSNFDAGQGGPEPSMAPSEEARQSEQKPSLDALDDPVADGFEVTSRGRADGTDLGGKAKDSNATDAPPPWSELKTKAGKERKRLPLACIACRRKKIRCSGEKPACKHCLRSRIPCVYKVTTRKAAPRTDYMAMLDKRLKRMEERIIKVIPKADQVSTPSVTRAVVKPAIPGMASGAKSVSKKRGAEEAFGTGLEAWANASVKSGTEADGRAPSPSAGESDENQLFKDGVEALPPKDIQEHLAEVYFDNVYGQAYHLLHKPSYMRKLKNNSLPPVLVLSVCAVAARFSPSPKLNSPAKQFLRGEEWAAPARDICTKRYESPNITILTCLLILGLHEFGTCQGGRSWALGGQAIRMAFALQLHKDLDHDPMSKNSQAKLSFVDREIRRRIMWSCFIMDHFNSSGSERPMFIQDKLVNIPLPVKERHFQLDMPAVTETLDGTVPQNSPEGLDAAGDARDNMGVAAWMIRAIALWGRIISYVNQGGKDSDTQPMWSSTSEFGKLSQQADELPGALPEPLQYSADNLSLHHNHHTTNQFLLLHIITQQNILFLSRAALGSLSGAPEDFVAAAWSKAFAAADKISEFLKDGEESRVMVSAPFAGYCAFSSTMMHIRRIVSGDANVKSTAEAHATTNIRFLRKMMKFWGMFHWMEEDIRAHYRKALDRSRKGMSPDDSTMASPILQYGDWFNRYPHGVADADFMDPAMQNTKDKGAEGVLEQKPELQSVEEFFTTLSSPQAGEQQPSGQQPAKSKRKQAAKKKEATQAKASQQQPASLDMAAVSQRASSAQEQQVTPSARQTQSQPQTRQRRPSATVAGQTSGPASFHPHPASHSQVNTYHSMSPISPVNVDQFQQAQQGQPGFYQANMMHRNMPQQQGTMIQQPLDQQLSFGGYSMETGNMPTDQHMMNGVQGWQNGGANVPPGQQLHTQGGAGSGLAIGQHHQDHGQGQPAPNGLSPDGWFMPFDMQHPSAGANVGMAPNDADAFNGIFNSNDEMAAQNPLGGLRHAH